MNEHMSDAVPMTKPASNGVPQPETTANPNPTGAPTHNRSAEMNHLLERSHVPRSAMSSQGKSSDGMRHFSSLTRSTNHHHHGDVHAGYLSDGDTLKSSNMSPQLKFFDSDSASGYISEGNSGSHQKRTPRQKDREKETYFITSPYRLDLDECTANDVTDKGKSFFHRDALGSNNNSAQRTHPYSGLNRYPNTDATIEAAKPSAMPLLRHAGSKRTDDGPRRPPVTPPPRDPETTLSPHPRLTNGSLYTTPASVDNYLRIYASPVRKPRAPANHNDLFTERHPGDLFVRPLNVETTLMSDINNSTNSKSIGNALERRTKLKVSGSTQTSPQEMQLKMQTLSANQYSTNSLNRNINRHPPNGSGAFFPVTDGQSGPPRCRSVVQPNHTELTLPASVTPIFFDHTSNSSSCNPGHNASPVPSSPRPKSSTSARLSMPNQAHELSILNIDPDRYDATDNLSLNAALPPKSQRQIPRQQLQSAHADSNIYDKIAQNGLSSKSGTLAANNNYVDCHYSHTDHNPPGSTVWERSPAHSARSDSRGHPLSYSIIQQQTSHLDDLDSSSTASYPLTGISRSSAPGSPLLMYSLPRSGHNGLNQPRTAPGLSPYVGSLLAKIHSKNDEMHGSAGSLASTTSSMYSSPEERHAHEVRKLRKELEQAQERVTSLTTQLSTNTHVVAAFENSLNNMTQRLETLTAHSQRKDGELLELRRIIDVLRQQGAEAGLISGGRNSSSSTAGNPISPNLVRRHTFNSTKDVLSDNPEKHHQGLSRQLSTESVASLNSNCSNASHQLDEDSKKKKKKSWIRSSLSKAFSRSKNKSKNDGNADAESVRNGSVDLSNSVPNSPLLQNNRNASRMAVNGQLPLRNGHSHLKPASSSSALDRMDESDEIVIVEDLQRQLREKEMTLTDFQLQAVKSAQQLDQYKEDMQRMRNEIEILRQDNMRLHRLVAVKRRSLSSERKSPHDGGARSTPSESGIGDDESPTFDARRIPVKVIAVEDENGRTDEESEDIPIGSVNIGPLLRWEQLDRTVRQLFKEYVSRVDSRREQADVRDQANLGLTVESIAGYHLGMALRNRDEPPTADSSPIDYLKCDDEKIRIALRGSRDHAVDTIAFESLIPKSFFQRYISLLTEHKRVILCGPSGTGKSFLARKMAQHVVMRSGKSVADGAITTFNVDQKSSKELRQYLLQIAEQCESSSQMNVPSVVVIDNLHHVGSLGEVFNGFLSVRHHRCPFIIGTMNQATCSPANLQLHHNFRWILCANHMEPVKGFLGRYLRRKIIGHELAMGVCDSALTKIIDWIPRAWQHINTFLEKHSSSDVTLGPRLFLDCPISVRESQDWFTLLWNYSLVPYILEAVKEGLQLYGRCIPTWEDPVEWILETYPWPPNEKEDDRAHHGLNRLRPEDVGFETYGINNGTKSNGIPFADDVPSDPLSHMLMQLQEAALYSTNQNNLETNDPKMHLSEDVTTETLSLRS
ncbi:neuron navigator 2-like isoform X2 [Paramacrobiotus metropolitanus]|uniref:neuron navigator 2-like isoform X2 n=1 Tax=Paramacrobiotus metropolitanus TaxID=2943436 RepID=UPI0024463A6E|nr:neuron navigator 2-like isoform X2 [Paramacrobiotus metropolitanus]